MKLLRLFSITKEERRALASASLRLVLARVLLSRVGMARTRRMLERWQVTRNDRAAAELAARAVLRAADHLPLRTNCLDRAVALWWLLSARGVGSTLRIGVRKNDDATLAAHAWVEHDGSVLLDESAADFSPLDTPILAGGKR